MPRPKLEQMRVNLDKVERKLIKEVKALKPEYRDFTPVQIVKMELRYRLFDEVRRLKGTKINMIGFAVSTTLLYSFFVISNSVRRILSIKPDQIAILATLYFIALVYVMALAITLIRLAGWQ